MNSIGNQIGNTFIQTCTDNCCKLFTRKYIKREKEYSFRKKAGVILYRKPPNDFGSLNTQIILVQSNGNYWGFPKGGIEPNESEIDCAKRETYEETGLAVERHLFENCIHVYTSRYYVYFLLNLSDIPAFDIFDISKAGISNKKGIPEIPDNDSTGISFIKIECLIKLYRNKLIKLNKQCIEILNRAFGVNI